MLHTTRSFHAPSLGVHSVDYLLLHPTFRINLKIRKGGISDDGLFGLAMRQLDEDRCFLLMQLEGRSVCRVGGRGYELEAGSFLVGRRNLGINLRQEGDESCLYMEWELGPWGEDWIDSAQRVRLPHKVLSEVREHVRRISGRPLGEVEAGLVTAELLGILQRAGAPLQAIEAGELRHSIPPNIRRLAQGLDKMYASVSGNPAVYDLQEILGWSRPRIHRSLSEFQQTYAFHGVGGWRALQRWWRLPLGAFLMSAPNATTEEAARILGYSSPSALCTAFAKVGLPSPGGIRRALAQLS